jgi:hypothetical protein
MDATLRKDHAEGGLFNHNKAMNHQVKRGVNKTTTLHYPELFLQLDDDFWLSKLIDTTVNNLTVILLVS